MLLYDGSGKGYLFFEPTTVGKAARVGNWSMICPGCTVRPGTTVSPKTVVNTVQRWEADCMCIGGCLPKQCELVDGHFIAPHSNVTPWAPTFWPPRVADERFEITNAEAEAAEMGVRRSSKGAGAARRSCSMRGKLATGGVIGAIVLTVAVCLWLLVHAFSQPTPPRAIRQRHRHASFQGSPLPPARSFLSGSAHQWSGLLGEITQSSQQTRTSRGESADAEARAQAAAARAAEASAALAVADAEAARLREDVDAAVKVRDPPMAKGASNNLDAGLEASPPLLLESPLGDSKDALNEATSDEASARAGEAVARAAATEAKAAAAFAAAAVAHATAARETTDDLEATQFSSPPDQLEAPVVQRRSLLKALAPSDATKPATKPAMARLPKAGSTISLLSTARLTKKRATQGTLVPQGNDGRAEARARAVAAQAVEASAVWASADAESARLQEGAEKAAVVREPPMAETVRGDLAASLKTTQPLPGPALDDAKSELAKATSNEATARAAEVVARAAATKAEAEAMTAAVRSRNLSPLDSTAASRSMHATRGPSNRAAPGAMAVPPIFAPLVVGIATGRILSMTPAPDAHGHQSRDVQRAQGVAPPAATPPKKSSADATRQEAAAARQGSITKEAVIKGGSSAAATQNQTHALSLKVPPSSYCLPPTTNSQRSFGDVVAAYCIFLCWVFLFCGAELYRWVAAMLWQRSHSDGDKQISSQLPAGRQVWLDHAKLLAVWAVILHHVAMPVETMIVDGGKAIALPGVSLIWGRDECASWSALLAWVAPRHLVALLAFASGFTAKSELDVKRYEGIILIILARTLFGGLVSKSEMHHGYSTNFSNPDFYGGHLWYLYALVEWRLAIQLLRPLYPIVGMASAVLISVFADKIFNDPGVSTWDINGDDWALKKAASFFFAFAAGFYCKEEWLHKLRPPGVRAGALLVQLIFLILFSQRSFVEWYRGNIPDITELHFQDPALLKNYQPEDQWQARLLAMASLVPVLYGTAGWLPHSEEWHTRYGVASLYPYVLHWHVVMYVLPHWDEAMNGISSSVNTQKIILTLIIVPCIMVALGGVFFRLMWWVLLEPTWTRIIFRGRIEKLQDAYQEHGLIRAFQVATKEFVPMGIHLHAHPWVFGAWFAAALALWVTMLMLFDTEAFIYCHNDGCSENFAAFLARLLQVELALQGEQAQLNASLSGVDLLSPATVQWQLQAISSSFEDADLLHGSLDVKVSVEEGQLSLEVVHAPGIFLPGGGAFATFVTVLLFIGLATEIGIQLLPKLTGTAMWLRSADAVKNAEQRAFVASHIPAEDHKGAQSTPV